MNLRSILRLESGAERREAEPEHERCLSCGADLEGSRAYERYRVCHACGHHFHLSGPQRVASIADAGSFREHDRGITAIDPISFGGPEPYRHRVVEAQRRTGLTEAALTGRASLFGRDVELAVIDLAFLGGSIGVASGERLARAFERAADRRTAVITVLSTSGTRMREGLLALMQLPRVIAAQQRLASRGLPHIAVLTDPTTGSAYAGFVNLADYVVAEPGALVGYAALRAVREGEGADLPEGAHTAESHLAHGLIDGVMAREDLRPFLGQLLDLLLSNYELRTLRQARAVRKDYSRLEAWHQVQLSRHERRPTAADLIRRMSSTYVELRGDRTGIDDPAITAGIGLVGGQAMMLVGQVRSHGDARDGGRIGPAGFRKARRAIELAGKFRLPLVTFLDTAGASPTLAAEEGGLGHAIAHCTEAMLAVPSASVAVVTGEANSEAAVSMGVADRVLMLENAVYEVISPEDAARILYQEIAHVDEVAQRLRLTSHDCLRLGIADAVVGEPGEGAHTNHDEAALLLRRAVLRELTAIQRRRTARRLAARRARYRGYGATHDSVRGTLERRLAHLRDRVGHMFGRHTPGRPDDAAAPEILT